MDPRRIGLLSMHQQAAKHMRLWLWWLNATEQAQSTLGGCSLLNSEALYQSKQLEPKLGTTPPGHLYICRGFEGPGSHSRDLLESVESKQQKSNASHNKPSAAAELA